MPDQLTGKQFRQRLSYLILVTWIIPPIFGLTTLVYINMFNVRQMCTILTNPIEPVFIIVWLLFAVWFLPQCLRPVYEFLDNPAAGNEAAALRALRNFPFYYWGAFLTYLLLAPASVMISAIKYAAYMPLPIDWFRIHMVSLVISIIVGLPIFFMILNLFGLAAGRLNLQTPHVTLRIKVFMIGALLPLMIDTMLVQYYWTRTGYFTTETFFVWLTLEGLAICGSMIFVRSIGQSLSPLQELITQGTDMEPPQLSNLVAKSTDELGVITTDYRHLLEELYRHRHDLEKQVQLRTQELVSINKELESFAYSVSHDLRAPLRSINGFAHILNEHYARELDEEGRDYLQRIVEASTRMSQIIDALLNLSRVTRSSLKREQVNISDMAYGIIEIQNKFKNERLIEIRILPDLVVSADRNLTQVLLENLLSNALKFTVYQKHAIIEIGKTERDGKCVFFIKDNGVGFDMRFADKLFTAFQRLHPQYEFEGVGIGLATVQRIINIHGGHIWGEAGLDEGATFYFTL